MKTKLLSILLVIVLLLSTVLTGCGDSDASAPTKTPEITDEVTDSDMGAPVTPDETEDENTDTAPVASPAHAPGQAPGSNAPANESFVKDGKIYINEIIYLGQVGISENHAWVNNESKSKKAADELLEYRSSDDVKDWNIEGAMDDAFDLVPTSATENLKNGDVVTWTYEINEEKLERLKGYLKDIEIVIEDGSAIIEGLEPDVMEINVFDSSDYISIDCYTDDDGNRIWYGDIKDRRFNGAEYSELLFEVDEEGKTSWEVGDKIKIKITSTAEQLEEYGYVLPTYEGYVYIMNTVY